MMKKIMTLSLCLLFIGVSVAVAAPGLTYQATQIMPLAKEGTFEGNIGYRRQGQNATIVGTMNGTYLMRSRGGRFTGDWTTQNRTGTLRGVFGKHFLIGRITIIVNGTERTPPIVGFLKAQDNQFIGRFMSYIGPALYFWGTYT